MSVDEDSDDSLKYFKKKSLKKIPKQSSSTTTIDRRVLSSDSDVEAAAQPSLSKNSKRIDIWVEVYSEKDERWVTIDVFKNKVDCVSEIIKAATHPMIYVFAWNNDNSLKDVSHRYCPNLNTITRKLRVEPKYLASVIGQFAGQKTARDVKEDNELNKLQLKIPMPTSLQQ
jgi:xeroderma pigmentosum group C-complementing protein